MEGILDASGNKTINTPSCSLPRDYSVCIPSAGLSWLYKYGITDEEISKYHFGYSERMKRLILPVYNQKGELVYWQGRNLGKVTKENPKYINVRSSKDALFFVRHERNDERIVLVEDILSACKVGRVTNCLALLGSYVSNNLLSFLKDYGRIFVWLDEDKRFESIKYSSRVKLLTGKDCSSIITELDPKELSEEVIKNILTSKSK